MDGTASAGVSGYGSRSDHVHPTDTSRYAASNPAGYINSVTLSGDVTGSGVSSVSTTVTRLQGNAVSVAAPTPGQGLIWSASTGWTPTGLTGGGTITGVTAGNGLTGGGTSGTVTVALAPPVSVANGGTNATTPAGALTSLGAAPTASPTFTGTVTIPAGASISGYAPLASPSFTGSPSLSTATATTPAAGDNSTKVATTAFVAALPAVAYNGTFRNRLINGNFSLDQRNEGAAVTASTYGPDKWRLQLASTGKLQVQRVALPVNGAGPIATRANYVLVLSSLGAYTPVTNDYFTCVQVIEADVIADLQFGASSAQPVVLSFWANLSGGAATGAYSISLRNNGGTRSYVTTFNMPAQGTWYYFQVPVPGDTAGTWVTSGNGGAMSVLFDGGCASPYLTSTLNAWQNGNFFASSTANKLVMTSSAALNIANVQLEVGTAATPFELLDPATALVRAQRYMEKSYPAGNAPGSTAGGNLGIVLQALGPLPSANYNPSMIAPFKVTKRAVPTVTAYSPTTGASGKARDFVAAADTTATPTLSGIAPSSFVLTVVANTAATSFNIGAHWTADADF